MRPVVVTHRAAREIADAAEWWRAKRPAATGLLRVELARAFQLLGARPEIGARATNARLVGVRRVLLSRVRYHLYYRVRGNVIEILALWHVSRGTGPSV